MRRGTTPDYILTVAGYDLTQCTVYVAIKQGNQLLKFTGDRLNVEYDDEANVSNVTFGLTQKETLGLKQGNAEIQLRFIDVDGVALATEIKLLPVLQILFEDVIAYGNNGN